MGAGLAEILLPLAYHHTWESDDMTHKYQGVEPKLHPSVYLAPGAQVIGDVSIGEDSSVQYRAEQAGEPS